MPFQAILTTTFIIIGAGIMSFSLLRTHKILQRVKNGRYLRAWQALSVLMGVFVAGYIGAAVFVWADITNWMLLITGGVFLLGALFVFLVVSVGYLTIQDLQDTQVSRDSLDDMVKLRTAEIQAKNTALLKSQEELAKSRDEALQAYHTRTAFLRNMSHELRTPLNAILGYSDIVIEDLQDLDEAEIARDVQKIRASGKSLLTMIKNVLDLSKLESDTVATAYTQFDVAELLQGVVREIEPLARINFNQISLECEAGLPLIKADFEKVERIMGNLLDNACKFTHEGRISVTAKQRFDVDRNHWLIVSVSDTGIGIAPDQMQQLFRPFSQLDSSTTRKYGGAGLGLAISKLFCESLGGALTVSSQIGGGSTFTVKLPIKGIQVTESPKRPVANRDRQPLALIIDDDPAVRDLVSRWLHNEGFQTAAAINGSEGLRLARELRPQVITLDVMMPDIDGWHVLATLKTDPKTAGIPIVMLTMMQDRQQGYALGAADYLTKPVDREMLLTVLRRYAIPTITQSILVVEDDDFTREILSRTLGRQGWNVQTAVNGFDALKQVKDQLPSLILLDLMMPEMDGFQFVQRFRQVPGSERVPVIVLTAKELTESDRERLNGYVEMIVQKGAYRHDVLLAEVQQLLDHHRQSNPQA